MTSGSRVKPPGSSRWSRCSPRAPATRVDRQLVLARQQRLSVVDLAVGVERVPDRERDAGEPLPADQPVAVEAADPVVDSAAACSSAPSAAPAACEERLAQVLVAAAVADVPLPAGDDLERLVAVLVEVGHPLRRRGLAVEVAGRAQLVDDRRAGREGRLAGELGVRRRGGSCAATAGCRAAGAVAADHRTDRQLQLAPPDHVGQVAERADHRDAGTLVGLGSGCASTGISTSNSGERTVVPNIGW
jgi:hypothetical protein